LARVPENPVERLISPNRYVPLPDIGVASLLRPGGARPRPGGRVGTGVATGEKGTGGGAAEPENVIRYDFTPWANDIVNKIQSQWSVAQSENAGWKGEVGVNVIIKKNGELLAAEIAKSSNIDIFDEAALRALRLCAPFPPLPPDFPADRLEMYFVFQYGYR
jgi:TonB family protein